MLEEYAYNQSSKSPFLYFLKFYIVAFSIKIVISSSNAELEFSIVNSS